MAYVSTILIFASLIINVMNIAFYNLNKYLWISEIIMSILNLI